ncbi:MAG TPA: hypothetical protein VJB90_03175 [Candidatus Nanoarchaeia archaeon]|nr:hypothetical protein [Candidatus Nanoarchaeia archaeon]
MLKSASYKGQTSIEAAMLFSFMVLALTVFLLVIGNQYVTAQENRLRAQLKDVTAMIETELSLGVTSQNGYYRQFEIPNLAGGVPFSIQFLNSQQLGPPGSPANYSEVILSFQNSSVQFETYIYLPDNVDGNISHGQVEVKKQNGLLYIRNTTG